MSQKIKEKIEIMNIFDCDDNVNGTQETLVFGVILLVDGQTKNMMFEFFSNAPSPEIQNFKKLRKNI